MARKETVLVINGEEYVSKAAEEAGASLTLFGKRIPLVVDATRLLEWGLNALRGAFTFLKSYTMDSIAAFDAYAASQTKLNAQSKLTGVSLAELNRIAANAKEQFALSSVVANEAATTVAKYASRAGDASRANELLAAALDLGAASGLNAAETMEALEQGLRGQDEGFDKLLGKNPSALWKEYADANGLAVGKMDDTQKRLAELTAIMDAAAKVQGSYTDRVTGGAGEQDKLNNALDDAKVKFGQAIQPARILITQGLVVLVEWLGRAVLAFGRVANAITVVFVGAFKVAESVVGGLAVALGKLTGNKALEQWGTKQAASLGEYIDKVKKLEDRYLTTGKAAEESAAQQVAAERRVTKETEEERKKRLAAEKKFRTEVEEEYERLTKRLEKEFEDQKNASIKASVATRDGFGKALTSSIDTAAAAIQRIRDSLREAGRAVPHEEFKRLDDQSKGYIATLTLVNNAHRVTQGLNHGLPKPEAITLLDGIIDRLQEQAATEFVLTGNAEDHRKRMELIAELQKKVRDLKKETGKEDENGKKSVEEIERAQARMADNVANVARSALDAAKAFGVIDSSSAASLNSAINIGNALAKIATSGFSFAGVTGVVAGVASIVSTMMQGDKERRELTRENNALLRKINTEGLRLSNKASGQQIAGVAGALTADQIKLLASMTTSTGRDAGNQMLVRLLADKGLRLSDLDAVATELGFKIRRDNGQIELSQLPLLFQALQQNGAQLTRIGQGFAEQFAFFKDEQRVRGASGISGLQGVVDFVRNVGGARALQGLDLSDPGAARNQLLNMLTGLNNDVFSPADFGRLTGEEFKSVLLELIGLLDNLKDTTPVTTSPPTTTTDDVVSTTAGVTLSVQSVQEVIEAMHTGVEGVLKEHTALQTRMVAATEQGLVHLSSIDDKMDDLIAATNGQVNRINRELGELRLTQLANAGRGPEF